MGVKKNGAIEICLKIHTHTPKKLFLFINPYSNTIIKFNPNPNPLCD